MAELNAKKFENSSQLENIYKIACDTTVSVIVEGDHGIGKSESVYSFAQKNNFHVEPLFLSHQEVADLIGIPTLERDASNHALTTWSKPIWLHRMEEAAKDGKRCVLFLDELNRAQTEVRQAARTLTASSACNR
jgi:MoxR-like ATPase